MVGNMIKKLLLCMLLCLWTSSLVAQGVYEEGSDGEVNYNPCGKNGKQRDGLTAFYQYKFNATYKDLNEEETKHFLKVVGMTFNDLRYMQDSNIVNVRVFRSKSHKSYAFVSSWLFQNHLNGQVLVELYCIRELPDGASALFIKADSVEQFLGKPYSQIGIE